MTDNEPPAKEQLRSVLVRGVLAEASLSSTLCAAFARRIMMHSASTVPWWHRVQEETIYMTKTVEEFQVIHSEMCATAGDLGMTIPPALAIDFNNVEQGSAICKALDAAIAKFRVGLNEQTPKVSPSAPKDSAAPPLAPGDKKGQVKAASSQPKVVKPSTEKKETTEQKMARQKKARLERDAAKPKIEGTDPPIADKEKKTVAKKAVVKKAAKKAAKSSKKSTAKKAAASPKGPRAGALDEAAKVTWVGIKGENPYRGDKKDRYEVLKKASGKTVKTVLAGGTPSETLRNAVKNKIVTLA